MDERPVTIEDLERWVEFGARWRALQLEPARAVIELCECTGAPVERRVAVDPEVIAYVRAHAREPW